MMRLNGYGVICGYDDGTIRPDSYVSVTEFLTMMGTGQRLIYRKLLN